MTRVAILGASGYTGLELIRILLRHPHAQVTALVTRRDDLPELSQVHPALRGQLDLTLESLSADQLAERADCVFGCLPHAASAAAVKELLDRGLRVVDLSADYRLNDVEVYERWYGETHPDAERLGQVPYGLPELYREEIRGAALVANPGCYPTCAILALAPLLKAKMIEAEGIIIDSKSGVSGAGRSPKPHLHFPEANESVTAYGIGTHRHLPEIDQVLSAAAGASVSTLFTPHLIPMDRGILSTCYAAPRSGVSEADIIGELGNAYEPEPFVQVVSAPPATKQVVQSNQCHVFAKLVRDRVVITCAIDNLVKGASGAAVQNFNLMFGYEETTALV